MKHYYFRLNKQEGLICWSRSREGAFKNPNKSLVLQVHRGPSNAVKKTASFSANDLHCYAFWVATGSGILDLFAYNEDSFKTWIAELDRMASINDNKPDNEPKSGAAVSPSPADSAKGNQNVTAKALEAPGTKVTAPRSPSPARKAMFKPSVKFDTDEGPKKPSGAVASLDKVARKKFPANVHIGEDNIAYVFTPSGAVPLTMEQMRGAALDATDDDII